MAGPLNKNYFTTGGNTPVNNTVGNRYQVNPYTREVVLLPPLANQEGTPGDNERREANERSGERTYGSGLTPAEMSNYANTIAGKRDAGYGTVREYDPTRDLLSQKERDYVLGPNGANARLAQEDIAMNAIGSNQIGFYDNLNMLQNREPSFQNPSAGMAYFNTFPDAKGNPTRKGYNSTGGSYGGSLVTGGLSTNLTGLPEVSLLGFGGGIADSIYADINFENAVDAQTKNFARQYEEDSRRAAADPNASSFAMGGNLAAETKAITNENMTDDEFFAALENDPTVGAAVRGDGNDNSGGK